MDNLQNMYLVRTGAPGTQDGEDMFMPLDVHVMIEKKVFAAAQARRYRERVLRFRFDGHIDAAQCLALAFGIRKIRGSAGILYNREYRRRREFYLKKTKTNLLALVNSLFQSDETDQVNITNEMWQAWDEDLVTPWTHLESSNFDDIHVHCSRDTGTNLHNGVMYLTSKDGLHHIQFKLYEYFEFGRLTLGVTHQQTDTFVSILYYGPQRFRTGITQAPGSDESGSITEFVAANSMRRQPRSFQIFEGWQPQNLG